MEEENPPKKPAKEMVQDVETIYRRIRQMSNSLEGLLLKVADLDKPLSDRQRATMTRRLRWMSSSLRSLVRKCSDLSKQLL